MDAVMQAARISVRGRHRQNEIVDDGLFDEWRYNMLISWIRCSASRPGLWLFMTLTDVAFSKFFSSSIRVLTNIIELRRCDDNTSWWQLEGAISSVSVFIRVISGQRCIVRRWASTTTRLVHVCIGYVGPRSASLWKDWYAHIYTLYMCIYIYIYIYSQVSVDKMSWWRQCSKQLRPRQAMIFTICMVTITSNGCWSTFLRHTNRYSKMYQRTKLL